MYSKEFSIKQTLEQSFEQSLYPTIMGSSKHFMQITEAQSNLM